MTGARWEDGYWAGYEVGFWVGACATVSGIVLLAALILVVVLG